MLSLTFLGTSAARPTVERNVSSIALQREGETMLFECGEGTQRQMMRYGVGFTINEIFFTHFHADHFLGVIGLIRTFGLQGRTDSLHLYGPSGAKKWLTKAVELGVERPVFEIGIHELDAKGKLARKDYDIEVVPVDHGRGAIGYAVREHTRLGRFDPDKAKALGIPEGPMWGRIHKGETIEVEGRKIRPAELVGAPRQGRVVVMTGDTRPCEAIVTAAQDAEDRKSVV